MEDTSLGWVPSRRERIAVVRTPPEQGEDWGWNSPYWLGLGVPWGGLIASAADLLTTQPLEADGRLLTRMSNVVASALR
jgi:hypothetical protein